jgi:hypothetical protein
MSNLWGSMWIRPRATIRAIVAENPRRSLWVLSFIVGLNQLLGQFETVPIATRVGLIPMVLIALVLAPFVGWIMLTFWSWLILITGRMLKGAGSFETVRASCAWSCVPLIGSDLLWIPLLLLFGPVLFMGSNQMIMMLPPGQASLLSGILLAKIGFVIWALVLFIAALSEVQQFSTLRAIGNIVLSFIGFMVIWTIVGVLVGSLMSIA